MNRIPNQIWMLSPFLFVAGFALLYSKEVASRIAGGCIVVVALGIAYDPVDIDNWHLAAFLAIVGSIVFCVFRPGWLKFRDGKERQQKK